jgi:hypothetical protein
VHIALGSVALNLGGGCFDGGLDELDGLAWGFFLFFQLSTLVLITNHRRLSPARTKWAVIGVIEPTVIMFYVVVSDPFIMCIDICDI